jgi:hypothetical protein
MMTIVEDDDADADADADADNVLPPEPTVPLFSYNQIVSTHKALETNRRLEAPRSGQTRVQYVSWIDLRRDADAVVSFKPVRVQHVDVDDTKWDFVRFAIESKFGIHSDGSGNAGVIFGFRLGTVRDYVLRSR